MNFEVNCPGGSSSTAILPGGFNHGRFRDPFIGQFYKAFLPGGSLQVLQNAPPSENTVGKNILTPKAYREAVKITHEGIFNEKVGQGLCLEPKNSCSVTIHHICPQGIVRLGGISGISEEIMPLYSCFREYIDWLRDTPNLLEFHNAGHFLLNLIPLSEDFHNKLHRGPKNMKIGL